MPGRSALRLDTVEILRTARSNDFRGMVFSNAGITNEPTMLAVEPIRDGEAEIGALLAIVDRRVMREELARINLPGGPQGPERRLVLRGGEPARTVYDSADAVSDAGTGPSDIPASVWTAADGGVFHAHVTGEVLARGRS